MLYSGNVFMVTLALLSPGGARFRGFFLRVPPAIVMTISPERLAEIERILSEAAGRSRARRLRRRGFAVLFGPEPGHVQLFTDDGEMIFETRPPRWAAAQFVVMVRHASSTFGAAGEGLRRRAGGVQHAQASGDRGKAG